jgi:hypothetical protein
MELSDFFALIFSLLGVAIIVVVREPTRDIGADFILWWVCCALGVAFIG